MRHVTGLFRALGWIVSHGRVLALLFLPFPVVIAFGHARMLTGSLYRASLTAAATVVVVAAISGAFAATGPGRAIATAFDQASTWWQYRQQLKAERVRATPPPHRVGERPTSRPATAAPYPDPAARRVVACDQPGDHSEHLRCQPQFVIPDGGGHR